MKYNWFSTSFFNAANTFCDAEIGALVAPRYLAIEVGDNDHMFDVNSAKEEYIRLKKHFSNCPDHLRFNVFKGVHEFCPENDDTIDWVIRHL